MALETRFSLQKLPEHLDLIHPGISLQKIEFVVVTRREGAEHGVVGIRRKQTN